MTTLCEQVRQMLEGSANWDDDMRLMEQWDNSRQQHCLAVFRHGVLMCSLLFNDEVANRHSPHLMHEFYRELAESLHDAVVHVKRGLCRPQREQLMAPGAYIEMPRRAYALLNP